MFLQFKLVEVDIIMLNSRGYMLADTLVALSIILFVCVSLLPIWQQLDNDRKDLQKHLRANHILYENLQKYTLMQSFPHDLFDPTFACRFTTTIQPLETNVQYVKGCVSYKNSQQKQISICDVVKNREGLYSH